MLLKKIIFLFLLLPISTINAQINDIELESLDDLSILEEFESDNDKDSDKKEIDDIAITEEEEEKEDLKTQIDTEELQELNIAIDRKAILEFSKKKESKVDELVEEVKQNAPRRFKNHEIKALKIQLNDISNSPIKVYEILKGTEVVKINNQKTYYIPKNITVRAHVMTDFYKNRYIVNKDGNILYKVHYKELADIAKVTNLYRAPRIFKRLPKKKKKQVYDKNFDYSLKLKFHAGLNSPNYTNELLDDPSAFAPFIRTEASFLTHQKYFFESGLSLMFESTSGAFKSNGQYSISSISAGPIFKSQPVIGKYGIIIQPRISLFSRVSISKNGESDTTNLSETALLLGLEKEKYTPKLGHFIFGLNFQRKWMKADSKNLNFEVGNHVDHDDSIALHIGHRSDWTW